MKSGWSDYVGFEAITYAMVNSKEKPWEQLYFDLGSLRLDDGSSVNFDDPGLKAFFRVLSVDEFGPETRLSDVKNMIRSWESRNILGPGQCDTAPIRALRDTCAEHGWETVDGLMETLFSATPSKAFECVRTYVDPADPGADGSTCYSLSLSVMAPRTLHSYHSFLDKWRVLGSTPEFALKHLSSLLESQYSGFISDLNAHQAGQIAEDAPPQGTFLADMAVKGMPDQIILRKNGKIFATVNVRLSQENKGFDIRWNTVKFPIFEKATVLALAAIAPDREARVIRAELLEDELGM